MPVSPAPDHDPAPLPRPAPAVDAVARAEAAHAAGHPEEAARWADRAFRLAPRDVTVRIVHATLGSGADPDATIAGFEELTREQPFHAGAAMTLVVLHLRAGQSGQAASSLAALLHRMAPPPLDSFGQLAAAVCRTAGLPGWIGLDGTGRIHLYLVEAGSRTVRMVLGDAAPRALRVSGGTRLLRPAGPGWADAELLLAHSGGQPLVGSGLRPARLAAVEGYAELSPDGRIRGWARLPADPAATPAVFHVADDAALQPIALQAPSPGTEEPRWSFTVPTGLAGAVAIVDGRGRHLWGSPLLPGVEAAAAREAARGLSGTARTAFPDRFRPLPTHLLPFPTPTMPGPAGLVPCDVVVPVYGGLAELDLCLRTLRPTLPRGTRLVLVNDGSPDPAIEARLAEEAGRRGTAVLSHERPRGFPAAVNAGLAYLKPRRGRDVVILNADTVLPPRWLERLSAAAHCDARIGSATPLTNDGTLVSFPEPGVPAPTPTGDALAALAERCWDANGPVAIDLPTGVGFCMLMKGACLAETGLFREDVFAQGYGEENDWCLRAAHLGWRHVAAPGVFVSHSGGRSFGAAKALLMRRNGAILERLHPGYDGYVQRTQKAEPLLDARRRVDRLALLAAPGQGTVALVTHDAGGGVERHVARRCDALRAAGLRPVVLLPSAAHPGRCTLSLGLGPGAVALPNLRFDLPGETDALAALLREAGVRRMEVHHLLHHHPSVARLPDLLSVPYGVTVHDYGHWCPRISLTGRGNRYCGEPLAVRDCEECIADLGSRYGDGVTVSGLREGAGRLLRGADRVTVSCDDVAARIGRQFPGVAATVTPWDDVAAPAVPPPAAGPPPAGEVHVLTMGAIGVEKGFEVLLACARDAARRDLPLRFTVAGFTVDDARLMDSGRAFVTGPFAEADGLALVQAQAATLGFVPSVCPETWCYALSTLWRAGLPVVAFGLGAQGQRVARSGGGWILPPGLSPAKINDALVRNGLQTLQATSSSSPV